jgi:hypothetical protein
VAQLFGAPFAVVNGSAGYLLAFARILRRGMYLRGYNGDKPVLAAR